MDTLENGIDWMVMVSANMPAIEYAGVVPM